MDMFLLITISYDCYMINYPQSVITVKTGQEMKYHTVYSMLIPTMKLVTQLHVVSTLFLPMLGPLVFQSLPLPPPPSLLSLEL